MKKYKNKALWVKLGWFIALVVCIIIAGVAVAIWATNNWSTPWFLIMIFASILSLVTFITTIVVVATVRFKTYKYKNINIWVYDGATLGVLGKDDKVLDKKGGDILGRCDLDAKVNNHSIEVAIRGSIITVKIDGHLVE